MLQVRHYREALLIHLLVPSGPIPTVFDPDGVYPYPSYVETSRRPVLRELRFVQMENDHLRVTICPDLGGKVHSILHKASGQEVLFVPESVHPVRILPRMAFVPGGLEVSFPISHTPVQLEAVRCQSDRNQDRVYVCCGERELHSGMQWTVEYSLGEADPFLTQRTCFRNPTAEPHGWMSWSNAAVPARADSEFHFPNGPVLVHGREMETIDWATRGPRRLSDVGRMTGYFWLAPDRAACGVFTPSLGMGLYHYADPGLTPGMKLWTYGLGKHEAWGRAASLSGQSYIELQGGPVRDQSVRSVLCPGATHTHVEFWLPSVTRLDEGSLRSAPALRAASEVPWFDWPERPGVRYWLSVIDAFAQGALTEAPPPPGPGQDLWPPRVLEGLGDALGWLAATTNGETQDGWRSQLGCWLAAAGQIETALRELDGCDNDWARAVAARLYLRATKEASRAAEALRAIRNPAFAMHPQVVVERDCALAALGPATLRERERWLQQGWNTPDEWVRERMAALRLDQGRAAEAKAILEGTSFQLVHQRYARTELWSRICQSLGCDEPVPDGFGEDDLAAFGAYRQTSFSFSLGDF
ncbi:MAG: DUF5107 domain-containing protein [Verrucomicrobiota bacterium]